MTDAERNHIAYGERAGKTGLAIAVMQNHQVKLRIASDLVACGLWSREDAAAYLEEFTPPVAPGLISID